MFSAVFALALVASAVVLVVTTHRMGATTGNASVSTEVLGLTFFRASRAVASSGSSSVSLKPGLGILIIDVLVPLAAAALVFLRARVRDGRNPSQPEYDGS
jgi:hypothetical protein